MAVVGTAVESWLLGALVAGRSVLAPTMPALSLLRTTPVGPALLAEGKAASPPLLAGAGSVAAEGASTGAGDGWIGSRLGAVRLESPRLGGSKLVTSKLDRTSELGAVLAVSRLFAT